MKRVLIISSNTEKTPFAVFPLGAGMIAGSIRKAGYETALIDFAQIDFSKQVLYEYLNAFMPELVAISVRNLDNCCMNHPRSFVENLTLLAAWIREWKPATRIVIGGSAFSLLPQPLMQAAEADFGISGDGCTCIVNLLAYLSGNKSLEDVAEIIYESGTQTIFYNTKPDFPAHTPFVLYNNFLHPVSGNINLRYNIQAKKGCNFHCLYCSYPVIEGRTICLRSPRCVAEAIDVLYEEQGTSAFDFVDNVFNNPQEHAVEICREILKRKYRTAWGCFLNPAHLTEKFVKLLVRSGCTFAEIGIDSGSAACLKTLQKNFNKNDIAHAVKICREQGLHYGVTLLWGTPGETLNTVKETLQFLTDCKITNGFGVAGIRILPCTDLYTNYCARIMPEDLLEPQFYFSDKLDKEEFEKALLKFRKNQPGWVFV